MTPEITTDQQRAYTQHGRSPSRIVVLKMSSHAMKNYVYFVVDPCSSQAVVIDPAWQMDKIDQALVDTHSTLAGVLITHSHPDHVDLAVPMAEKYKCPIWMSNAEIADSGFHATRLIGIDADPLTVGHMRIDPIFTPGHTPGCTCYLIGDNLFTGDVLFAEGCGICPNIQAAYAMSASLEKLKARLAPQTCIFSGHSYGKPPGQMLSRLLKENVYLQFSDKESFAAFRLRRRQDKSRFFDFS